jgi:CspA family cold shock protein
MRVAGRVKWFNSCKGIGRIVRDNGEEITVRAASVQQPSLAALEQGQPVTFEITRGPRGTQAEKVVPIGRAPATE